MSLIDTFSKPRWQHAKPEIRREAVAELDDQDILLELVNTDTDHEVQSLALSRITLPDTLDQLTETLDGDLQKQARAQRFQQLLPSVEKLPAITDDATLVRIASLAEDSGLTKKALEQVSNTETLLRIASSHPQARMRLGAANGINDLELLQKLLQQSKQKDKAVYRYCKEQLDAHHTAQQAETELRERVQHLAEKARGLAETTDAIEFKGNYLLIKQQWPALQKHASKEQEQQITAALELGEQRQQAAEAEESARQQEQAQTAESQQAFSKLLAELEELDRRTLDHINPEEIAEINATLNGVEERWVHALQHAKASSDQTARCKLLLNEWRSMLLTEQRLLDKNEKLKKNEAATEKADRVDYVTLKRQLKETEKLISTFVWPESHISIMPEQIKRLHEQKAIITDKLEQLKKNEKQNRQLVEKAFEKFREELKTNHFDNADREYRRLRNVMRRLNPDQQHHYQQDLRPLMARLNEIHDWQGFAIEPKKTDLIQRMQALIDTGEDPDVLAAKIKALQAEWKALGHLAPHRDQELWQEFKAAADKAYEPCKAAFAERAVVYQQNVERRMELVAQLIEYEKKMHWPDTEDSGSDTPPPDWKLVQKTLDTARQAFRNIKPVDRKGERKTQKKLKAACDRIYHHVKMEYERNIKLKEEMIERARELVEMEDLDQAISRAKTIQREWKEIGMTPMRVDRKLWKKFRGACDAVFARLDEQRQQARQAVSGQIAEAEELLQKGRALVEEGHPHLKKELTDLHAALRDIELPGRFRHQLNRQFSELENEVRNQAAAERKLKEQKGWQLLTSTILACAEKSTEPDNDIWQEIDNLPKGIDVSALKSFHDQGPADTAEDDLREACIALEVLFEKDSPADDKKARMAYQMKRLVEGMGGQQAVNTDQQLLDAINRFVAMKPAPGWVRRFCATVDTVKGVTTE